MPRGFGGGGGKRVSEKFTTRCVAKGAKTGCSLLARRYRAASFAGSCLRGERSRATRGEYLLVRIGQTYPFLSPFRDHRGARSSRSRVAWELGSRNEDEKLYGLFFPPIGIVEGTDCFLPLPYADAKIVNLKKSCKKKHSRSRKIGRLFTWLPCWIYIRESIFLHIFSLLMEFAFVISKIHDGGVILPRREVRSTT